jgi:hypothetical protein
MPENPPSDAITQALAGMRFPAARDDLVGRAQGAGAPGHVIDAIARLPGEVFDSMADVHRAFGEMG